MRRRLIQSTPNAIDLQELGAQVKIYGEINDPTMRWFNPSLAFHEGELHIAIRSCNFMVTRHGNFSFRDGGVYSKTDVIHGILSQSTDGDSSFEPTNLQKLELSDDSPTRIKVSGLEDVRLFSRKDGLHAIGFESDRLTRHLHNGSAKMAEYLIKGNKLQYLRTLEKPDIEVVEKNWSPPDVASKEFDFTYSPTQTWKDGKVTGDKYTGIIHGGTQLLKQKDGTYLSLVHNKIADTRYRNVYDRFVYYTYLARHNKFGIITHLSKRFRFGTHENIEFASGMVEHDGNFIISIGIRDCKYALVKVERDKLIGLLEEFRA